MSLARVLDPLLVLLIVLGLALYLGFRGAPTAARSVRWARWARAFAWLAWGSLWLLSTPLAATRITAWTETTGPDLTAALAGVPPDEIALVVLAGGMRTGLTSAPPRERLDGGTTARVLGAARLYHTHGFGLIVLSAGTRPEADAMEDLLTTLGVPAARLVREEKSINTRENALFAAEILRGRRLSKVVLTTSATHLRRAVKHFRRAGVEVIPAAVDVIGVPPLGLDALLPSAHCLARTQVSLHEILGYLRT